MFLRVFSLRWKLKGEFYMSVKSILGRKIGMTAMFDGEGKSFAVTAVSAGPGRLRIGPGAFDVIQRHTPARLAPMGPRT